MHLELFALIIPKDQVVAINRIFNVSTNYQLYFFGPTPREYVRDNINILAAFNRYSLAFMVSRCAGTRCVDIPIGVNLSVRCRSPVGSKPLALHVKDRARLPYTLMLIGKGRSTKTKQSN